jgi:hypothetical protein
MNAQRRSPLVAVKRSFYYLLKIEDDTVGLELRNRAIPTLASSPFAGILEEKRSSFSGFFSE